MNSVCKVYDNDESLVISRTLGTIGIFVEYCRRDFDKEVSPYVLDSVCCLRLRILDKEDIAVFDFLSCQKFKNIYHVSVSGLTDVCVVLFANPSSSKSFRHVV